MNIFRILSLSILLISFCSCKQQSAPYPRPLGFHRIDLPQTSEYNSFNSDICPFSFEYPKEGEISKQSDDSCWVDIYFPVYDCKWHITYRNISSSKNARFAHQEEHRGLIFKHGKQASNIQTSEIAADNGYGTLYEVYGNVGTPAQFFYGDSLDQHVVMTSFYFNTATKNDSLLPIINYMKKELIHMVETIEWN